jgi:hypothetical protein
MDSWWLDLAGVLVICFGLVFSGILLWRDKSVANVAGAIGFALAVVIAGVAIANLSRILKAGYSAKNGETTVGLDMAAVQKAVDDKAIQVRSDTEEVKRLTDRIAQMNDGIQHAYQSLYKLIVYILVTHNKFPPPPTVIQQVDDELRALVVFAYPDPKERERQDAILDEFIKKNLPLPNESSASTPTP